MSYTTANKTPHKEIHSEQEKRIEAEKKLNMAAKHGQLPQNKELTHGIDKAQRVMKKDEGKLSNTGKAVTKDINNILDTTKRIVEDKNEGELLQNAYYHSHQAGANKSYSERIAELKQLARGDSSKTREEAKNNVSSLATIVKLAILSPEFRESINDVAKILNQLLKTQNERHEQRRMGDAPGSHQPGMTAPGARQPGMGATGARQPGMGAPSHQSRAAHQPGMAAPGAHQPGMAAGSYQPGMGAPGARQAGMGARQPGMATQSRAAHQPGMAARGAHQPGMAPVTEEKRLRRERRENKLIERLVDLAQTLHNNPESRNSINYLVNSSSKLKNYTKEKQGRMKVKEAKDKSKQNNLKIEEHKQQAHLNGRLFLENWIGDDYSLDPLIRQIVFLDRKSESDPELHSLLQDWKKWSTATIKDSSYVNDKPRVRNDVKDLVTRTRFMNQRYSDEISIIRREAAYINKAIQRDDSLLQLREDFSQLGRDILKDSNGQSVLKPELLSDAQVIIGSLIDSIKYIPLPPIHRNDDEMELELENIVLNATNVTPSNVRFIVQSDADKDSKGSRQGQNSFLIEISKIRAHLTSVNFYVDKKTGFPKITDRGLADIDMPGSGLSMKIEVVPKLVKNGNDVHSVFEAKTVTCSIGKLKIHLRETSHDTLYKILSPIINAVAKKKIETGIADYVKENMNKLNGKTASRATQASRKKDAKMQEKSRRK